jgi:hypothetical protein
MSGAFSAKAAVVTGPPEKQARIRWMVDEYLEFVARTLRKGGVPTADLDDEIQRGCIVLKGGELLWPPPAPAAPPAAAQAPKPKAAPAHGAHGAAAAADGKKKSSSANMMAALAAILLGLAAIFGPPEFIQHLTVFLLACVVGWHVIWNVTPALHTPLMSVTNAISGIIVIGGMLVLYGGGEGSLILGGVAVLAGPRRRRAHAEPAGGRALLEGVHQPDRAREDAPYRGDAGDPRRAARGRCSLPGLRRLDRGAHDGGGGDLPCGGAARGASLRGGAQGLRRHPAERRALR